MAGSHPCGTPVAGWVDSCERQVHARSHVPRHARRPRRDRRRPHRPGSAGHRVAGHRHRDLRLGFAPVPRQGAGPEGRRHPRPRIHGHRRGDGPGGDACRARGPGGGALRRRLWRVLFLPAPPVRGLRDHQRRPRRDPEPEGPAARRRDVRLHAPLRRAARGAGRVRARADGQHRAAAGPRRAVGRAGAVPFRHPPDRLPGGGERRGRPLAARWPSSAPARWA